MIRPSLTMIFWRILPVFLFLSSDLAAQQNISSDGSEVFQIVEQMPRFPGCENQGLVNEELGSCATQKMLEFVYQNITYPDSARKSAIEGTVVINFVIKEDGRVSDAKVVKEIGGGCGEEALRVVNLMNEKDIRWIPGMQKGQKVKVSFNLPIKYKLKSEDPPPPLPYVIVGKDTIYTEYDGLPSYGEEGELASYLESIAYPAGVDSCVAGCMVTQIFISKDGLVKIGDIFDYSNLGFDYQFEVIKLINATNGKWTAATREGRPVNCYVPLRITFKPKSDACAVVADQYDQAYALAGEAEVLYADKRIEEAVAKWSEALELMPGNSEFLLLRGQAFMEVNENAKACADLQAAKAAVPLAPWVEQMLPFICLEKEEEEGN